MTALPTGVSAPPAHVGEVEHKSGFWQYRAVCSGCDWKGDWLIEENRARDDFRRHQRLLREDKGIFACGCKPGDRIPWSWQVIGRSKKCPAHREPYIPKATTKPRKPPAVSTQEILEALRKKYDEASYDFQKPWFFATELRIDTGFATWGQTEMRQLHDGKGQPKFDENGRPVMHRVHRNAQALDAFAMHTWASKKFERIAFEVKVSRSDFLNEVKKPWKREPGMAYSNSFYYCTPPGLLKPDEIPEGCGLMEVHPSGHVRTVLKAPFRNADEKHLPIGFIVSILRRHMKEEAAETA